MAVAIRLARGGSKKRPYYKIIVADARSSRDGKFIERIGSYNPLLAKDDAARVTLDTERAKHWLSVGAQPSDRVARFLDAAGVRERTARNNPNKAVPGEKAKERAEEREAKAAEAAEKPAEEVVTEEVVTEEAVTEEAPAAEAPAEDSQAETEAVMAAEVEAATEAPTPEAEAVLEAAAAEPVAEVAGEADANEATPNSDAGDDAAADEGESAQKPAEG